MTEGRKGLTVEYNQRQKRTLIEWKYFQPSINLSSVVSYLQSFLPSFILQYTDVKKTRVDYNNILIQTILKNTAAHFLDYFEREYNW